MLKWVGIVLGTLSSALRTQRELALENLALRRQVVVLKSRHPRPNLTAADRLFWVLLARLWADWRDAVQLVKPETVVRWHRKGFRSFWRWKSRGRGRPKVDPQVRALILRMCRANPLWGAPRIHGELLKLGIEISEATVSKYMHRRHGPPSQTWPAFVDNHAKDLIALDVFTVPTATFQILFILIVLGHDRRQMLHCNVTAHPTAEWTARQLLEACGWDHGPKYLVRDRDAIYGEQFRRQAQVIGIPELVTARKSPWQNCYAERVIGSIRRDCLDHAIVLGERHLKRILRGYIDYYQRAKTHLSLEKDAPVCRTVHPPGQGRVVELKRVGGLHHEYVRIAA